MTAFAQPSIMADGTIFDAAYYAQNNPDIIAVLGGGESTLFQHYLTYGKSEGRLPYDPAANLSALSLNKEKKIVKNPNAKILNPQPEGSYTPTTYKGDDGYTYLDLGPCMCHFSARPGYSDNTMKNKVDDIPDVHCGLAYRQCIETGAIEIEGEGDITVWVSPEGFYLGQG